MYWIWDYIRSWFVYAENYGDTYIYDDFVELMEIEPFLPR
jgi:hypothetical protein